MTVYVVTSGIYSDYHIDAIFTDKVKAELYCAVHENSLDQPEIEEWDTDGVEIATDKPVKHRWIAFIGEDGAVIRLSSSLTIRDINVIEYKQRLYCGQYIVQATLDRDVPEEKATKIIFDRLAKWKYERQ